jgi:hypothetical protein
MPAAFADDDPPVLWTGIVRSSGGGAPAEVTAYLQPPADVALEEQGTRLDPIAAVTADFAGRFTLRSPYDDRIRAAEDRAGWISVLVVAMTADGMSMATDSVRFDSVRHGWSTRTAETERDGTVSAKATGTDAGVPDRPAVMTLHPSPARAEGSFHAMAAKHRICFMKKDTRELGVTQVTVGELDLAQHWGGQFNYVDTNTSTFEVGFRYEGEGGWSAGGSSSFSKEGGSESINPVAADGYPRHLFYRADMVFSTFKMDCGGRTAYSLKPTAWTGGMRPEMASAALCDRRYLTPVGPNGSFVRQDGSSQTFSGAFSIAGFGGGATSTNSRSVRHEWKNSDPHTRNLCGVSNLITRDTRVVSLP